jgi:rhodanese-related sulfurtransferase
MKLSSSARARAAAPGRAAVRARVAQPPRALLDKLRGGTTTTTTKKGADADADAAGAAADAKNPNERVLVSSSAWIFRRISGIVQSHPPDSRPLPRAPPKPNHSKPSTNPKKQQPTKQKVGFRYDAANLRWVRDKRQDGRTFDMSKALIRPFSGEAYMSWPVCHSFLTDAGLRSVPVQEARRMQKEQGWTLVDVRLSDAFEAERAEGAISAPLFRYLDERPEGEEGSGVWDLAKKAAMAAFAMRATERVPRWAEEAFPIEAPAARKKDGGASAAASSSSNNNSNPLSALFGVFGGGGAGGGNNKNSKASSSSPKVLLMCSVGGSMKTEIKFRRGTFADPERSFGRESRSLKAAYELLSAEGLGWTADNVVHVEGGLAQWRFEGLPLELGEEGQVVGQEADELASEEAGLDADEVRRRRRRRQRQRAGGMVPLPF